MVTAKAASAYSSRRDTEETTSARLRMVEKQIIQRGIRDSRVLGAMREVPRHLFVPEERRGWAYTDNPVRLEFGQTISQPYIVALMTEALSLTGGEKVLEVGTGSGYQAAILSRLAKRVYSIERIGELARTARKRLVELGFFNVGVVEGDGTMGLPWLGPFDAIIVTATVADIPEPLVKQLVEGGRLVLPVGEKGEQTLLKVTKKKNALLKESLGPCTFVPLIGHEGWKNNYEL